jgi:hypothetical protein
MKKFLFKLYILCSLLFLGAIMTVFMPHKRDDSYYALFDKDKRLSSLTSPKIVFAGGSCVAFGLDSSTIENAFGYPVVNMGVSSEIGLGRIIFDILPHINRGDILVIVPEYEHFISRWNGENRIWLLLFDLHRLDLLLPTQYYGFPEFKSFPVYAKEKLYALLGRSDPKQSTRTSYNEYGDQIAHLYYPNERIRTLEFSEKLNSKYLNYFFKIRNKLEVQGVHVLVSYPSFENTSFNNNEIMIHNLDNILREQDIAVISNPEQYQFETEYFYDTAYHLNVIGRDLFTERIIVDLSRYIKKK